MIKSGGNWKPLNHDLELLKYKTFSVRFDNLMECAFNKTGRRRPGKDIQNRRQLLNRKPPHRRMEGCSIAKSAADCFGRMASNGGGQDRKGS
mgnify:CR=1 FL=1